MTDADKHSNPVASHFMTSTQNRTESKTTLLHTCENQAIRSKQEIETPSNRGIMHRQPHKGLQRNYKLAGANDVTHRILSHTATRADDRKLMRNGMRAAIKHHTIVHACTNTNRQLARPSTVRSAHLRSFDGQQHIIREQHPIVRHCFKTPDGIVRSKCRFLSNIQRLAALAAVQRVCSCSWHYPTGLRRDKQQTL
jgi:hypothetical protein